ncbi:MAG: alpha/beta hydrolase [Pseudomonadota bacterium]
MTLRKQISKRTSVNTGVLILALIAASNALAGPINSHKDRLFAYPRVLEARDGGSFRVIDYNEARDIDKRDQVPERRVRAAYVDNAARRATRAMTVETSAGPLTYRFAGDLQNARFITIYIHGSGGNAKQGVNDFSFGGNFNRIKALMMKSGGAYLAPDAGTFSATDKQRLRDLFGAIAISSASARIVIACGSSGAAMCYSFASDRAIVPRLAGIMLFGGYPNVSYLSSPAGRARVPLLIAHGSRDTVFDVTRMEAFYTSVRRAGVPVKMVRFESGTHGTPIRMVDWREALNWMLTN